MISVFAGIAQDRAPAPSRAGGEVSNPSARSNFSALLQAFAVGLQPEAASFAAGLKDGEEGAKFRPLHFDLFSYALGFQRGKQFPRRRFQKRGGAHAL